MIRKHIDYYVRHLKDDIPAGIVVFLVALPLCLGVALASGAPLFSGLIAGMGRGAVHILGQRFSAQRIRACSRVDRYRIQCHRDFGQFSGFSGCCCAGWCYPARPGFLEGGCDQCIFSVFRDQRHAGRDRLDPDHEAAASCNRL